METTNDKMEKINVNRRVVDEYYRYKMPKLEIKFEGKKTLVVNIEDVGKALGRPSLFISKYLSHKIGTQMQQKDKKLYLNGHHDTKLLQDLLDGFVYKLVLCTKCENPETELRCAGGDLLQNCVACWYSTKIRNDHRLVQFIVKNLPKTPKDRIMTYRQTRRHVGDPSWETCMTSTCSDDWSLDVSEDAVKQRRKELCSSIRKLVIK